MSQPGSLNGTRVLPLLWWSESQLHAWRDCKIVVFLFPNLLPFVENVCSSSAGHYGRTTKVHSQKRWKRERKSPVYKKCRTHWTTWDRCLFGLVRLPGESLIRMFLSSPRLNAPFEAATPPNRVAWGCAMRKSRPMIAIEVEVSITHPLYWACVLCLFLSLKVRDSTTLAKKNGHLD